MNIRGARRALRTGPGRIVRNQSQRNEPRPYLNCRIWQWLTMAYWAGLRWEGGTATAVGITELIRRKSGRPEFVDGEGQGTTAADLDRGLAAVFPWMRLTHRLVRDEDLLEALGSRYVAGIAVRLSRLPSRQQRFSGGGDIGHQVGLVSARLRAGTVRYLDPLAPQGARGDWVSFVDLRPALMQRSGRSTFCSLMEVGDPMLTTISVRRAFAGDGATGTLPRGSVRRFRVQGDGFARIRDVDLGGPTPIKVGYVADVDHVPERSPRGRFYHVTDGPASLLGTFIRAASVKVTPPATDGAEDAYQRGVADGIAEEAARYVPADLPDDLFERRDD